jgi:hypothetical protein
MTASDVQRAMDDLKVVRNMIYRTRRSTMESGIVFVWWGFLSLVAIGLQYFFIQREWFSKIVFIWSLFILFGYLGTFVHLKKKQKTGVKSFIDRMIGTAWFACGISIIILSFVAPALGAYDWDYIPPLVTIILAIGVFISGMLYEWKVLSFIAFLWWAGSIFMIIFKDINLLIMGGLIGGVMIAIGIAAQIRCRPNQLSEQENS